MSKKISIIVLTYNRPRMLNRCVNSLLQQDYPKEDYEIIIVDDGSTNKINYNRSNIRYIKHKTNKGVAAARNTGIKNSRYDIIGFVADDYVLDKNYLKTIGKEFSSGAEAINFNLVHPTKTIRSKLNKKMYEFNTGDNSHKKSRGCQYFAGRGITLKKELIDQIGYFDETFRTSEDNDFLYRITQKDIKIRYVPSPSIIHNHFPKALSHQFQNGKDLCQFKKKHKLLKKWQIPRLFYGIFLDTIKFAFKDGISIYLPLFAVNKFIYGLGHSYSIILYKFKK